MAANRLQNAMAANRLAIGMFHYTSSPGFVEILGYSGFDFVIIDTEHTSIDLRTAEHLIRAAEASGVTPLFRVYEASASLINKALNFGARGIVVPHVSTAEQARRAVAYTKYPPVGERAACPGIRSAGYWIDGWAEFCERENRETLVILLLEGREALRNADEIMDVQGVDIVFFGPWDLSQSLGVPGQAFGAPAVVEALDTVVAKARARGISVMTVPLPAWTPERVESLHERGVNLICFPDDLLVFTRAAKQVATIKELAKAELAGRTR